MHFVVAWEIKAPGPAEKSIDEEMKGALKSFSWVRPLKGVYIVKVDNTVQRELVRSALVTVAKAHSDQVSFFMSPAMDGGQYVGWLPSDLWPKIAKRTE